MRTRDRIGIIIVKHLGSKNPHYPTNSYDATKFVALADELGGRRWFCIDCIANAIYKKVKSNG